MVPDRCGGHFTVPGSRGTSVRQHRPFFDVCPVRPDEHTGEVLRELGYDAAAITELRERGAVVSYQPESDAGHAPSVTSEASCRSDVDRSRRGHRWLAVGQPEARGSREGTGLA
jgi:hypothetical protein